MASWKQRVPVKSILQRMPPIVLAEATARLLTNGDKLVAAEQRACPVDGGQDLGAEPGELKASIHKVQTKTRSGAPAVMVLADARIKDGKNAGRFYGPHVEFGHRTEKGGHVPAHPFWFPTYRAMRRAIRKDIVSAGKATVQKVASQLLGG